MSMRENDVLSGDAERGVKRERVSVSESEAGSEQVELNGVVTASPVVSSPSSRAETDPDIDSRMPINTHPDWATDSSYVCNVDGVESTGTTGYKDVHFVPGEVFFCGVVMEPHLGSLGNLKVDKYVSKVNEAHYVLSLAVDELESLDRVIRAAEQSVSSLFGLSDRLRQLRAVDGVIRLRRKLAKKERKAKVQKIDGAVVPAGYEIQPCFPILDVAGKSLQSGDVRRGDVVLVRTQLRAYDMKESAGVYLNPVYIRKIKSLSSEEMEGVQRRCSTSNSGNDELNVPSYQGHQF